MDCLLENTTELISIIEGEELKRSNIGDVDNCRFIWTKPIHIKKGSRRRSFLPPEPKKVETRSMLRDESLHNANAEIILRSSRGFAEVANIPFTNFTFLKSLKKFDRIRMLSLSNINLSEIPKTLCNLTKSIRFLDLSYNKIEIIPKKIKWQELEGLNLSNNKFRQWPDSVRGTNFPHLQFFDISWNDLDDDYQAKDPIISLQTLCMQYCGLTRFPLFIFDSTSLNALDISGNPIEDFEMSMIEKMVALKYLNISGITKIIDSKPNSITPNLIIAHKCPSLNYFAKSNSTVFM